jgi:tetratricopeptide (TPR) repeat protein
VGRDSELTKLQEFIRELHGTKKLAIVGLGGVGKTQIAVEVAYCIRELHTNYSVFWIPCISYGMVEQAFMDIATMLQIPDIDPAKVKDQVKSCLSQHCPRKWLLIFDNADNMDMWVGSNTTFPPLRHFLPESQQGRILFTTRNHKLAVKLVGSNTISVPELDEKAGFDLLQRSLLRNPQLGGTEVQKKLLQRLTYLPLAIVQATAYINQNLVDLPTYMELLDEKEPDVVELLCEDFDDDWRYMDAQNPVITTWWLSFQQIQQLDLLAFDYLLFTGCIDPRNIPQTLFPPAASKKKAIDAIGLLKAFSFLSEREEMTFDMHQLVYLAIRTWLRKTKMFSKMIAAVASRLKDVLPNNGEGSRTLWRAYLPHALSMIHNEEFENQQSLFLDLLERIGGCLVDDGRYNEAETIFGNIVATRQREGNEPNESTLANMRALASIYWNQSKWKEAESLQLQTLETSRRVLGPNARIVLTTMTELANTLASQGRLKEAEELTQEAINSHESILGAHDKGTLACKACLASIHFEQEQYDKALKLLLELKESSLNELGSAHEANLTNLNNLACVYEQKGELEKAEDIYLQVLESKERIIGLAHPRTLTTMINLASLYHNKGGKSEKAEELLSQVVTMSESTLGPRHRLTLVSRNNLASSFLSRGQLKEAEPLLLQVLEIRRQDFGPSDPQTLESMKAVASLYGRQTEWEKEAEIRVQLVEGLKKMLGPKRPKTLQSMDALMVTYMNLKRWDEAETLGLRILETLKELPLSERPALTTSMYNLAFTYLEQGKLIEAGNQFVELMRWQNEILEPGAPETLRSMRGLALVYQGLERWQEAESLLIDVLSINTGCHGKDHVMTRGSMLNLVVLWKLMGKERDALLLLEECERLSRKKEKGKFSSCRS